MIGKVPAENVLGEIGIGHVIALNILNVGRFTSWARCGLAARLRRSRTPSVTLAQRKALPNKVIADFGLVRENWANMAVGIYTGEAFCLPHRGMMDARLSGVGL